MNSRVPFVTRMRIALLYAGKQSLEFGITVCPMPLKIMGIAVFSPGRALAGKIEMAH